MVWSAIAMLGALAALACFGWAVASEMRHGGVTRADSAFLWAGVALDAVGMLGAYASSRFTFSGYLIPGIIALGAMGALAALTTRAVADSDRSLGAGIARWAWAPLAVWGVVYVYRMVLGAFILMGLVNLQ